MIRGFELKDFKCHEDHNEIKKISDNKSAIIRERLINFVEKEIELYPFGTDKALKKIKNLKMPTIYAKLSIIYKRQITDYLKGN